MTAAIRRSPLPVRAMSSPAFWRGYWRAVRLRWPQRYGRCGVTVWPDMPPSVSLAGTPSWLASCSRRFRAPPCVDHVASTGSQEPASSDPDRWSASGAVPTRPRAGLTEPGVVAGDRSAAPTDHRRFEGVLREWQWSTHRIANRDRRALPTEAAPKPALP